MFRTVSPTDLKYLTERLVREEGAPPEVAAQMVERAHELKATNLYKVAVSHYRSYAKRLARTSPVKPAITEPEEIESQPIPEAIPEAQPPSLQIIEWREEENIPAGALLRVLLPEGGFLMVRNPTQEQIAAWDAEYEAMKQARLAKKEKEVRDTAAHAREVCTRMARLAQQRAEQEKEENTR